MSDNKQNGKVPSGNKRNLADLVSQVNNNQQTTEAQTLKVQSQEYAGHAFVLGEITTKEVNSQYGASLMVRGNLVDTTYDKFMVGQPVVVFLNNKRLETFNTATEEGIGNEVTLVCGNTITLKDGKNYVPFEVFIGGAE